MEFEERNNDLGGTINRIWGAEQWFLGNQKMQNHSLVPPNSFGPPTMVAVVVDFKDRAPEAGSSFVEDSSPWVSIEEESVLDQQCKFDE